MGWFTSSSSSSRPGYARSYAGSSYSSSSRHRSSTSRYKRSPRDGYLQHLYHKFQHFLRQLWRYAKKHPYKIFFMVIMPLVSGGVLHKLARQFGVNLPELGGGQGARGAPSQGGYYGSEGYGDAGGGGSNAGAGLKNLADGIGGLASMAKMAQAFL
ncbi:hypothetical protein BU24DRAFT_409211 [Aaosphaeria arxii CBS 175.79]|uniref:Uncharacterized protein n=1 Tax=Aaosphaeria arxii CBS 175.79 TaxID=1450172 RepID=A0A6A5XTA8_9PLEO|nr:uncharacterized protein BU24DRAFT_409211 [Aaosphaeria arxii CBS 175.79]KAF2016057.1 hypothetical protein BU24DRAFT_409211 [Aaosphaeria arxii CBS 175.79]